MARAIPLFRLADIRVTLDPSWFLIFLLVAYSLAVGYLPQQLPEAGAAIHWALGAFLAAALFLSVVAHEYSHALVARKRGGDVDEIMLFIFGGVAKLKAEPEDAASEFLVAAAGPLLSIVLGVSILLGAGAIEPVAPAAVVTGLTWLGWINLALAIFNLVPGFPLDGGRILRAILWWRTGDFEDATVGAARTGQVIAGLLILSGLGLTFFTGAFSWLWEVLIGWFLWSAASRSIRLARLRDAVEGVPVRELMTERVPAVRADHDVRSGLAQATSGDYPEIAVIERDGTLVGVVTEEALTEAAEERPERPIGEVAEPADDAQTIDPDEDAQTLVTRLSAIGDKLLLVVEDGKLLGTVDPRRLVESVRESGEGEPPAP
ncbi:MAG: site-2 protease family protein, partial [Gemmatimonadota bacterium]|nr:site-2 protease family protein [Gemmatimonadota bacterium]